MFLKQIDGIDSLDTKITYKINYIQYVENQRLQCSYMCFGHVLDMQIFQLQCLICYYVTMGMIKCCVISNNIPKTNCQLLTSEFDFHCALKIAKLDVNNHITEDAIVSNVNVLT